VAPVELLRRDAKSSRRGRHHVGLVRVTRAMVTHFHFVLFLSFLCVWLTNECSHVNSIVSWDKCNLRFSAHHFWIIGEPFCNNFSLYRDSFSFTQIS